MNPLELEEYNILESQVNQLCHDQNMTLSVTHSEEETHLLSIFPLQPGCENSHDFSTQIKETQPKIKETHKITISHFKGITSSQPKSIHMLQDIFNKNVQYKPSHHLEKRHEEANAKIINMRRDLYMKELAQCTHRPAITKKLTRCESMHYMKPLQNLHR